MKTITPKERAELKKNFNLSDEQINLMMGLVTKIRPATPERNKILYQVSIAGRPPVTKSPEWFIDLLSDGKGKVNVPVVQAVIDGAIQAQKEALKLGIPSKDEALSTADELVEDALK